MSNKRRKAPDRAVIVFDAFPSHRYTPKKYRQQAEAARSFDNFAGRKVPREKGRK
jgi:hypothetical protein